MTTTLIDDGVRIWICPTCEGDSRSLRTHSDDLDEHTCPECEGAGAIQVETQPADTPHPRSGEMIVTNFWAKPIPTDKFDWAAWFDNDEPDDDGNMKQGFGATEQEAIDDLLISTDE